VKSSLVNSNSELAIFPPAKSHPELIVAAVAGRDPQRTAAYAKKHGIPIIHNSYQDLLDDPSIDAIYLPLPNGLHYEWSIKALKAGKHVLVEKPVTSNSIEAKALFDFHASIPEATRPVLLEAFHYRFHPAWTEFLKCIDAKKVERVEAQFSIFSWFFASNDIRFNYELAGGALMDIGTYGVSALRAVFAAEPIECVSAEATVLSGTGEDKRCDESFKAEFKFPNGGIGTIDASLRSRTWFGLPRIRMPSLVVRQKEILLDESAEVDGDGVHFCRRTTRIWFWPSPHYYHSIQIEDEHCIKDIANHKVLRNWTEKQDKKAYVGVDVGTNGEVKTGEPYWSTYRHMLEQFVNKIKGRPGSGVWIDADESINQMRAIDRAYEKAGLPIRPTSTYQL
jgi:predicted dehydrogenase